ncbi:MAG: Mitochondrial import inner membrane translocase subunit tim8 [Phylliscum demangeonii]|nr:MAG: Mitochondrial import inner membrane translocase subunit tim8 [Phylliscum demangeonii]
MNTSPGTESPTDLSNLTVQDRQELQQFLDNEMQKARLQGVVHAMTERCWKKCMPSGSKISSGKLERGEESCLQNCVDRYLDASNTVLKHLETMRSMS